MFVKRSNLGTCEGITVQDAIANIKQFWSSQGATIIEPYDKEMGAGTFHPATFLGALGKQDCNFAYVQPSRRPTDGRYGKNPNRLQHYYQFQVLLKPAPANSQEIYIQSLEQALNLDLSQHDLRFVEDNWESPTLGAWGTGWEVWLNGMEVSQFTYFQQVGGINCEPVGVELTYGLERLLMNLQKEKQSDNTLEDITNVYDLFWSDTIRYGDLFATNEFEQSHYNYDHADVPWLIESFNRAIQISEKLLNENLTIPSYEQILNASHTFNLLDARRAVSVTERQRYVQELRKAACAVASKWCEKIQD